MLSNLKVLDFTGLLPGPFATQKLADMGAAVIRIESHRHPDLVRAMPPYAEGESLTFAYLNRSKRSLALDLKQPQAVEIIQRLILSHDIVLEQFRPGVMARLGLDYDSLRVINPRLIYCSITGYGQTGEHSHKAGHDLNYLARSGLLAVGKPGPLPTQLADLSGAQHAVMGILAAVIQRLQTGVGQYIDVSMTDVALSLQPLAIANAMQAGENPCSATGLLIGGSFYDCYETSDQRYLSVGCLEPKFFQRFVAALGHPEWAPLVTQLNPAVQGALKENIAHIFKQKTLAAWTDFFAPLDVCVEPALTLTEALAAAQAMQIEVATVQGKTQQQLACPLRFGAAPSHDIFAAPPLGFHSEAILRELGYEDEKIAQWQANGVVA